jgi:hypothetical protein
VPYPWDGTNGGYQRGDTEKSDGHAGRLFAEIGLDVVSEVLPDSFIGLFIYVALFVLMLLLWTGRRVFENS